MCKSPSVPPEHEALTPTARDRCPHAAQCAGCPLIDLPYAAQCSAKQQRVRAALSSYPILSHLDVEPTAPAVPNLGYRIRAKLMVGAGPRIGLYGRNGDHEIVDIPNCVVLAPEIRAAVQRLRTLLECPPAGAQGALIPMGAAGGALSAVDLRLILGPDESRTLLLTLVLGAESAPASEALGVAAAAVRQAIASVVGVAVNLRASRMPQVLGPTTRVLSGVPWARDRTSGAYQFATYGAFVQAHRQQAQAIHALIVSAFAELSPLSGQSILDVYGGSGAIGLALAQAGANVTLVESFAPAAHNALAAAREQADAFRTGGALGVRVGDAAEQLGLLAREKASFQGAVVNPPRRGVHPSARIALARLATRRIVYVSCEPTTLARDLDHFARLGYRATRVRPFDMIPLTDQVETVTVLDRKTSPGAQIVYQDPLLVIATKGPHDPWIDAGSDPRQKQSLLPLVPIEAKMSGLVLVTPAIGELLERLRVPSCALKATYLALLRDAVALRGTLSLSPLPSHPRQAKNATGRSVKSAPVLVRFERLEQVGRHSLVRLHGGVVVGSLLRRALRQAGHPIVGDSRWGHEPTNRYMEEKHGLDRAFWHCESVEGRTPAGANFAVSCPLWPDLCQVLESLRIETRGPK